MAAQTPQLEPEELLDLRVQSLPENRLVVLRGANENARVVHVGELVRTGDDERLEAVREGRHEIVADDFLGKEAPVPSLEHLDDMRVVQPVLPPPEELELLVPRLSWNRVLEGLEKVSILVGDVIAVVPLDEVEGLVAEGPARGPSSLGEKGRTDAIPGDAFAEIALALSPCTGADLLFIIEKSPHRVERRNDILLALVFE